MTPLTEAQLAATIAATKGPSEYAASSYGSIGGCEVGVGFELSAWSLLGEGCSSTDFPLFLHIGVFVGDSACQRRGVAASARPPCGRWV